MPDLFDQVAKLRATLGEEELSKALAQIEQGEQPTVRHRRGRKRADGRARGEFIPSRRDGVDGWLTRKQIAGERLVLWAETKEQLQDLIAERRLAAKARAEKTGVRTPRRRPKSAPKTLGEGAERMLASYPHRARSRDALETRLAPWLDWTLDGVQLRDLHPGELDREDWQLILNSMAVSGNRLTGGGLSKTTLVGRRKALNTLLNHGAESWDWPHTARRLELPTSPVKNTTKDVLPFRSWTEVFNVARGFEELGYQGLSQFTRFGASAGLRLEELVVLRDCDVDRRAGTVTIARAWTPDLGEGPLKTQASYATLPLPDIAREVLDELPPSLHRDPAQWEHSPLLWDDPARPGEPINVHDLIRKGRRKPRRDGTVWQEQDGLWRQALSMAGISYRPPKQLRHTFAYLALSGGGDEGRRELRWPLERVAAYLRHKDGTRTVETYYLDLVPDMLREDLAALDLAAGAYRLRPAEEQ